MREFEAMSDPTPEMFLLSAVIGQAIADARANSKDAEARRNREQAKRFLLGKDGGLECICSALGLDVAKVKDAAAKALVAPGAKYKRRISEEVVARG